MEFKIPLRNRNKEINRLKNIKNAEIKRNENGDCIIELFNKNKEKNAETIVDEDLYIELNQINWSIRNADNYVMNTKNGLLHRFILNYSGNDIVDHINNNRLDNRKENLRILTSYQNSMNKTSSLSSTSQYIGVSWCNTNNKWRSNILYDKKFLHLGLFDNEIIAAKVRDIADTLKGSKIY